MLNIQDLTLDAYGRRFLDKASIAFPPGAKVGVVGRNGVGKSTLFKLFKGEMTPTEGEIRMPRNARVTTVDQEHPATPVTLLDTVLAADLERAELTARLDTAEPEDLADIYDRLIEIGADAAPARAAEILMGLGFVQSDLARPMAEFSGGWRMRVALAAALFCEADLMLLDEPTNYLDLEGALWLEARLQKYPHTALIISHDRDLLNNSCTHTMHVFGGKLELYTGGYDQFERQRAEKARLADSERVKIEAKRAHMQAFVDRFRAKASKATQAQSRLKMLQKLPPTTQMQDDHSLAFRLPSPERPLPPPLARLEGVSVGYGGTPILSKMNLRLDSDDRIGLLGVNGAGKSTFAKLIAKALEPTSGELHRDRRMTVGWFHQHQIEALDPDDTPLMIITRALPEASEAQRRSRLAQFGFGPQKAETQVSSLSGGERARLLLNLVAMNKPHLLILDEPTNHLDIDSRRSLLDALNEYEGAVILITHDRSLMEMVADRLWLAANGTITPYDGDMETYAKWVVDQARIAARNQTGASRAASSAAAAPTVAPPRRKVATAPLQRKLEAAEQALARCTRTVQDIDSKLADPAHFASDPKALHKLAQDRDNAQKRLDKAEAEWVAAAETLEQAEVGNAAIDAGT